jgi:hypothetical protein
MPGVEASTDAPERHAGMSSHIEQGNVAQILARTPE